MKVFGLILLLFCACGGEAFTVWGPAMPLVVQVGASVTLPCSADTPLPLSELEVQWMKEDSGTLVHLFQEGESRPESQNPSYRGRARFFSKQVSKGNFSLLLVNVTAEDKGLYKCEVHTDNESNETMVEIDIERLVVTGAVEPVSAYEGKDVILNCSVDTHVPVGELQVEWVKINELVLVLLFDEGENRPESQDERFRGRAEFFSEEIPKGNFSMKLRDVKTEDRGEFMCRVHTDQESINATAWIQKPERLVVTGAVEPVSAYEGKDVILNCSVDTHVPVGELQVEWVKINELVLVLLFDEGENRPESQDERFRGRAEFFSEEIPKGNFSMKLRDVKTEDRGEFMCRVHTDQESINATAWIQKPGFSSLHILVLVCTISSAVVAVSVCIRARWFPKKKDRSNRLCLCCLHDAVPCILIAIAFTAWGAVERSFKEAFVCGAINFFRIPVMLQMAPYMPDAHSSRLAKLALPLMYVVVTTGVNSDALQWVLEYHGQETERKALVGLLFGGFLFLGVLAAGLPRFCLLLSLFCEGFYLFAILGLDVASMVPLYLFGSAGLSVVNSVALASEVFLKAEKGERTVELQLITLPFESFFLVCFLVSYCVQETENWRPPSSAEYQGRTAREARPMSVVSQRQATVLHLTSSHVQGEQYAGVL